MTNDYENRARKFGVRTAAYCMSRNCNANTGGTWSHGAWPATCSTSGTRIALDSGRWRWGVTLVIDQVRIGVLMR
ncbi:hypothetical protein SAMN04490220_0498 [Rhodococcus jostii]|uniref:Uncharacterized protein n=1 Tax=Rhodococcus jostii TaxID=132919 RepID=A0A1H4IVM9_RHOJO|nr:hypothetical protein SAMN04490220_0498 [Rhodococcus jostii]